MTNLRSILFLIPLILFSSASQGSRSLITSPMAVDVINLQTTGSAAQTLLDIYFQNVSNIDQTLELKIIDEMISVVAIINSPVGLSNWTRIQPTLEYFLAESKIDRNTNSTIVKLPKLASSRAVFNLVCTPRTNGIGTCIYSTTPLVIDPPLATDLQTTDPTASNYLTTTVVQHKFRLELSIAENRGAITGSVFGRGFIAGSKVTTTNFLQVPLNGGRPF